MSYFWTENWALAASDILGEDEAMEGTLQQQEDWIGPRSKLQRFVE